MAGMTDMSEPANIRQLAATRAKMALLLAVAAVVWVALYLWKHRSVDLGIACLWAAISIFNIFVYRAQKKTEGSGFKLSHSPIYWYWLSLKLRLFGSVRYILRGDIDSSALIHL